MLLGYRRVAPNILLSSFSEIVTAILLFFPETFDLVS